MNTALRDTRHTSRTHSFRFWFYLGLAATLLLWTSTADAADVTVTNPDGSPWTITINPGAANQATLVPPLPEPASDELASAGGVEQAVLAPAVAATVQDSDIVIQPLSDGAVVEGRSYADIYRSIPYSKTEYYANPSYRHDATMEVLFGQLRPGDGGRAAGRIIENDVYTPYRPYLFAQWDWYQTTPLLRPRLYRPLYGGLFYPGFLGY